MEALDQGLRPRDPIVWKTGGMKSIIGQFMHDPRKSTEVDEITEKAKQLLLQQPRKNN